MALAQIDFGKTNFSLEGSRRFIYDPLGRWKDTEEHRMWFSNKYVEAGRLQDDECVENGFIKCKDCHGLRQYFIDRFFGWMHCDCPCLSMIHKNEHKKQKIRARAAAYREEAFADYPIGKKYTFFNDDTASSLSSKYARKYTAKFDEERESGRGVLFWGEAGTGKTYIATAIMNDLIDRGYMVRFIRTSEMVRAMNNFVTSPTALDKYKSCAAVILDDLGAEDGKPQNLDAITRFLDFTEAHNIPMIVTTNLSQESFTSPSETAFRRVADRIVGRCDLIQLRGTSRRQQRSKERQKQIGGTS